MKGKVLSVLGPVEPSQLGKVLTHEHLSNTLDDRVFLSGPSELHHAEMSSCTVALENLWWIRQFPYSHIENLPISWCRRGPSHSGRDALLAV
ncbi:hypothetical protein MRX96_010266 [Rhipicephalus microplus]